MSDQHQLFEQLKQIKNDTAISGNGTLDVIGNAHENLIKNFAACGGQKAGEFYTPPEVSDQIEGLLDPQPSDSICDPACGSGSLLMKCGRKVVANHGSKQYALCGQEVIGSTWSPAKMYMFLRGVLFLDSNEGKIRKLPQDMPVMLTIIAVIQKLLTGKRRVQLSGQNSKVITYGN